MKITQLCENNKFLPCCKLWHCENNASFWKLDSCVKMMLFFTQSSHCAEIFSWLLNSQCENKHMMQRQWYSHSRTIDHSRRTMQMNDSVIKALVLFFENYIRNNKFPSTPLGGYHNSCFVQIPKCPIPNVWFGIDSEQV